MQVAKYKINDIYIIYITYKKKIIDYFSQQSFLYYLLDNDSLYLRGVIFTSVLNILMK